MTLRDETAATAAPAERAEPAIPVATAPELQTSPEPAAAARTPRRNAFIRLVQAIPEIAALDLFVNRERRFAGIAYGSATAYREVAPGDWTFLVQRSTAGPEAPIAGEQRGVLAGRRYTIIAFRAADERKVALKVFEDEPATPRQGRAQVRVINAHPDAEEVDLVVRGAATPLFSGVRHASMTRYVETDPTSGGLELRREGETTPIVTLPATRLDAGHAYTVVVYGSVATELSPAVLSMIIEEDPARH